MRVNLDKEINLNAIHLKMHCINRVLNCFLAYHTTTSQMCGHLAVASMSWPHSGMPSLLETSLVLLPRFQKARLVMCPHSIHYICCKCCYTYTLSLLSSSILLHHRLFLGNLFLLLVSLSIRDCRYKYSITIYLTSLPINLGMVTALWSYHLFLSLHSLLRCPSISSLPFLLHILPLSSHSTWSHPLAPTASQVHLSFHSVLRKCNDN